jgi:hypothetical protein
MFDQENIDTISQSHTRSKSISRESKSQKIQQPRKRATASQQAKHLPLRTDPPRPRATLSAKAIASCTLPLRLSLSHSINSTNDTHFHLSLSSHRLSNLLHPHTHTAIMSSSQMQEIMEMPREFIKDGTQFINRCTYVVSSSFLPPAVPSLALLVLL